MVVANNEIDEAKMQANRWQFRWQWRCSGMTRGTSPDKAHPGLHSKPLDAAIGRVPAPYCPDSSHGRPQNIKKTQLLTSNYGTFRALVVCENFVTRKGPSTHIIDATSVV
jgi:hypothetical protein